MLQTFYFFYSPPLFALTRVSPTPHSFLSAQLSCSREKKREKERRRRRRNIFQEKTFPRRRPADKKEGGKEFGRNSKKSESSVSLFLLPPLIFLIDSGFPQKGFNEKVAQNEEYLFFQQTHFSFTSLFCAIHVDFGSGTKSQNGSLVSLTNHFQV